MASSKLNPESDNFHARPRFWIGQHDSARTETLYDDQISYLQQSGFNFVTGPITNSHFYQRVVALYKSHVQEQQEWLEKRGLSAAQAANPSLPGPIVETLTDDDTSFFPTGRGDSVIAYSSPWIDPSSADPHIASISRQVLNIEVAYASFCGVRTFIVPGPRQDGDGRGVAQFARAVQEALMLANKLNIIVQLPMYREPGLEETVETLSSLTRTGSQKQEEKKEIDIFTSWDTWNTIRTVCNYSPRLFIALHLPRRAPEKELQERWFAEPLHFLTLSPHTFQRNSAGNPTLNRHQQDMINRYMRLKNVPWLILQDVGPSIQDLNNLPDPTDAAFPSLAEAHSALKENRNPSTPPLNPHVGYLKYLERQQAPFSAMESESLTTFQDWLQSPLQPLADNLESAIYEVFESDPVKYDQYEKAIAEAMADWTQLKKSTSTATAENPESPELVVAVAGAGRGPLVTRVLRAAERTKTPIQLWAVEKNQNAYVYLLRQNKLVWNNQVTVVKTDMRGWEGPRLRGNPDVITKVDILVTELLGSFGDNELSPECIDGIQHHIARPHGLSIPHSYTAHLSPIAAPRIHADILSRSDPSACDTPWVVRLFAHTFMARSVPKKPRFQQAWEFVHPVEVSRADDFAAVHGKATRYVTGGTGSMLGSTGTNDHNARHCHLTFVCPMRGVVHGLAGYFESVLYASQTGGEPVEISILPDQIDRKSKDMVSWFPIYFPLKTPLSIPQDAELEVSMWRQTDDKQVWYEWIIEVFAWVGPQTRIRVGGSVMHTSRSVACLM